MRSRSDVRFRARASSHAPCRGSAVAMRLVDERDIRDDGEELILNGSRAYHSSVHMGHVPPKTYLPMHQHMQTPPIVQRAVERGIPIHDAIIAERATAAGHPPAYRLSRDGRSQMAHPNTRTRACANARTQAVSCSFADAETSGHVDDAVAVNSLAHYPDRCRSARMCAVVSASTSTVASSSASSVAVASPHSCQGSRSRAVQRLPCSRPYARAHARSYASARASCTCERACYRGCRCTCHAIAVASCSKRNAASAAFAHSCADLHIGHYEDIHENNGDNDYDDDNSDDSESENDSTEDILVINRPVLARFFSSRSSRMPARRCTSAAAAAVATTSSG